MSRQKSEDPIVPKGVRKFAPSGRTDRGGKGVPVNQDVEQLGLPFATAARPQGVVGRASDSSVVSPALPKAKVTSSRAPHATMEEVIEQLDAALAHVARNKGAPGPDGQRIEDVQLHWVSIRSRLAAALRNNSYVPGPSRRKEIPKPGGGVRGLSIPNVEDRVVQEALRRTLEPLFEPTFHPSSHGFRPKRSCHTAIAEASSYVQANHVWVVDIDLSKFFDRVHHQRLLARLSQTIDDRTLRRTLSRVLRSSTVLPNGVLVRSEEGVPQGGPLSPLLSNIVLDELDRELSRRGHRFVRYADDVAVFVRSKRAGQRVMASMTRFIEGRLRLLVNEKKSRVRPASQGNLLGFRFKRKSNGKVEIWLSTRSLARLRERIRELTPRTWGGRLQWCIARLKRYLDGWFAYFGIASQNAKRAFKQLDAYMRRRVRVVQLKHWKRKSIIVRQLNRMEQSYGVARSVYRGRRGWWVLSNLPAVTQRLDHSWFKCLGHVTLLERRKRRMQPMVAPAQHRFGWG